MKMILLIPIILFMKNSLLEKGAESPGQFSLSVNGN